ncbi:hypothetical protein Q7P37_006560 [Cladosporium fusiforme]
MRMLVQIICCILTFADGYRDSSTPPPPNANHIFNAIHSSTRMWGSALNHNGMSMFIATVSPGVELYFGGSSPEAVNGTEWLAFDPELSSWSVRASPSLLDSRSNLGLLAARGQQNNRAFDDTHQQTPLFHSQESRDHDKFGYLQTYRTKHQLRLLYLDGMAGSLSGLGSMDMQDMILLHGTELQTKVAETNPVLAGDPYVGGTPNIEELLRLDYVRADRLCALAQKDWQGRIDGFLRAQWTHEIILCAFENNVDLERTTVAPQLPYHNHDEAVENLAEYRTIANRFDGIGGDRVRVDYDSLVTLFGMPDSFHWSERGLPRVNNDTAIARRLKAMIANTIMSDASPNDNINWQSIVDQVVSRYGDSIARLASGHVNTFVEFRAEIEILLRPFIDFETRNRQRESERCATQLLPPGSESIAAEAVLNVTSTLCDALLNAHAQAAFDDALEIIHELQNWLGWTTWKRCRGCDHGEVCFVPVSPLGGFIDHSQPRCLSNFESVSSEYWDIDLVA